MVLPSQASTTDQISPTDARVQGNLLREYEQKFANLPDHLQLTKLCSNAGLARTVEKGQYFTTLDDTELDRLKGSCREYTLPRSDQSSQVGGWIRGNTEIGPVLDVKVCYHQGSYGVEIMIESLFRDRTVSWVRIVNGINKYVTETSEEIPVASVGERSTGKPVAKARPRPTPTLTLSPVPIPYRERKWIDTELGKFSQSCFEVSKLMIRLLRHDESVPQEDGAVRFDDLAEKFKAKFDGTPQWPTEAWIAFLENRTCISEQSRDIQEVLSLILHCRTMYCYRMTSPIISTMQFYQTRSNAIALFNTLPAICVEKVLYIKTGEAFFCKVHQSPWLPRVVLTPNSQCGRQDPPNPEARTSADHQSEQSAKYEETRRSRYEETRRGNVDYRIQGMPHSTVQKEDCSRKEIVKRLIQQFENHPNRDSLIQDLNKTEEFNPFSEKSKELITSMGNMEYFELCETSSKIQCPDSSLYWEVAIV